ncbi:hypothetical protein NLU13_4117 [Sarocladium strictum]|uniref:Uncharacterized protein n=1 Tax=Sarocladium strictum TaxID=5046 RepID=A0AA39L8C6_SARSR|nr:hypothetical protein NLU13_4117 [Sarocladium strictum]
MSLEADFGNQTWVDNSGQQWCSDNPDEPLCATVPSNYYYTMSLAANVTFLAIFGLSLIGFLGVYVWTRRATAFTCLGYGGRIMGWVNPWDNDGFLMQICCLTIGPAFMAAGVYLCLRRIVAVFGPENSRIPPAYYTRIFIPCDVVALVFQAVGGALASIASSDHTSVDTGSNIMIVGLTFQVATILGFITASTDFAVRVYRRYRVEGSAMFPQDPALVQMRASRKFKCFLVALGLAAFLIMWRSVFRVAELSEGWDGELMHRQDLFIGFEGVLIAVAVVVLNVFHPVLCGRELFGDAGGMSGVWGFRRRGHQKVVSEDKGIPLTTSASTTMRNDNDSQV